VFDGYVPFGFCVFPSNKHTVYSEECLEVASADLGHWLRERQDSVKESGTFGILNTIIPLGKLLRERIWGLVKLNVKESKGFNLLHAST
jgi:hypothetical protein